jgi:hypothetical protein
MVIDGFDRRTGITSMGTILITLAARSLVQPPGPCGSMIELALAGNQPLTPNGGGERSSVLDGDTVVIRGRVGVVSFAEVVGRIEPARKD